MPCCPENSRLQRDIPHVHNMFIQQCYKTGELLNTSTNGGAPGQLPWLTAFLNEHARTSNGQWAGSVACVI
eukprot:1613399-Amphidinium_carterae.1